VARGFRSSLASEAWTVSWGWGGAGSRLSPQPTLGGATVSCSWGGVGSRLLPQPSPGGAGIELWLGGLWLAAFAAA